MLRLSEVGHSARAAVSRMEVACRPPGGSSGQQREAKAQSVSPSRSFSPLGPSGGFTAYTPKPWLEEDSLHLKLFSLMVGVKSIAISKYSIH